MGTTICAQPLGFNFLGGKLKALVASSVVRCGKSYMVKP